MSASCTPTSSTAKDISQRTLRIGFCRGEKGFFKRSIFELELTAAEQPQTKELGSFGYLTFNFDSTDLAEQFNAAFRSAIRICNAK